MLNTCHCHRHNQIMTCAATTGNTDMNVCELIKVMERLWSGESFPTHLWKVSRSSTPRAARTKHRDSLHAESICDSHYAPLGRRLPVYVSRRSCLKNVSLCIPLNATDGKTIQDTSGLRKRWGMYCAIRRGKGRIVCLTFYTSTALNTGCSFHPVARRRHGPATVMNASKCNCHVAKVYHLTAEDDD